MVTLSISGACSFSIVVASAAGRPNIAIGMRRGNSSGAFVGVRHITLSTGRPGYV